MRSLPGPRDATGGSDAPARDRSGSTKSVSVMLGSPFSWTALDSAGQSHDLVHLIVFKDFWTGQTARTVFPYYCTTQINTFSPLFSPSLQRYDLTRLSAENRCQASRDAIGRGPPRIARQMGVSLRGADIGMPPQRADHVPPGSIAAHTPARPLA